MKKKEKDAAIIREGFTLIELLITMSVIGILAGVIFIATNTSREKANIAAFKQEMSDAVSGLSARCYVGVLYNSTALPQTKHHDLGVVVAGSTSDVCGSKGNLEFEVTANAIKSEVADKCGMATIKPEGVTFSNADTCR